MMRTLLVAAAGYAAYRYFSRPHRLGRQSADYEAIPDDVLTRRVRGQLAAAIADAGRIQVSAAQGTVTLRGTVLSGERDQALNVALSVPGVLKVLNQLEPQPQEPQSTGRAAMKSGFAHPPQPAGATKDSDPDLESAPGFRGAR